MDSMRKRVGIFFSPITFVIFFVSVTAQLQCSAAPFNGGKLSRKVNQDPLSTKVNQLEANLHYGETLLRSNVSTQAIHLAYQAYHTAPNMESPYIRLRYYSLAAQLALTGGELSQNLDGMPNIRAFAQRAEITLAKKSLKHMVPLLKILKPHQDSGFRSMTYSYEEINGRIALLQGNYEKSCTYLRESGRVPADSAMASFGPDLSLAESLLRHGYKIEVAKFLVEVGKYWHPALILAKSISAGKMPVFSGQNVAYNLEHAVAHAP